MSAVTAVSQRYTGRGSGVRKWCDGGQIRCQPQKRYIINGSGVAEMYAIIKQANGQTYTSMVFGYYCPIKSRDDYERYLESIHNQFYIVLNKAKTQFVKLYVFPSGEKHLNPQILITDGNQDDWTLDEKYHGCANILLGVNIETIETEPLEGVLQRCIQLDSEYKYIEYPEITNQNDIDNLMWTAGDFHDARIKKLETNEDGVLYLLFDGVWGCEIEMWLEGDVAYSTESRDPEYEYPYWFDSSMVIEDGFIYFYDCDSISPSELSDSDCWFKARKIKYHIISQFS